MPRKTTCFLVVALVLASLGLGACQPYSEDEVGDEASEVGGAPAPLFTRDSEPNVEVEP